jgi:hypothetical protein
MLLVEGDTERRTLPAFFKRWLDPQLESPAAIRATRLKGSGEYRKQFARRTLNLLGEGYAVIGLIDRYGSGIEYRDDPGIDEWYRRAKRDLEEEVGSHGFRQHFAVHETEAWFLSEPANLPGKVREVLPAASEHPERVDLNRPPAKLLSELYQKCLGRPYQKILIGSRLFSKLDPEAAAAKCPHLKLLLDDLLELAKGA